MPESPLRRVALATVFVVIVVWALTKVVVNSAIAYGRPMGDGGWVEQWNVRLEPVRQQLSADHIYGFSIPILDETDSDYVYFRGVDEYLLAPIVISDTTDCPLVLIDCVEETQLEQYLAEHGELVIEQRFGCGLALMRVGEKH